MSVTPGGINFQELGGSPTMEMGKNGVSGQRLLWVPNPNDLQEFLQEVSGLWVLQGQNQNGSGGGTGGQCYFQPPMQFPGFPALVPARISVEPKMPGSPEGTFPVGIGVDDQMNSYRSGWKVTVQYETVYYQTNFQFPIVPNGTYLTYSADLGGEMMEVPGKKYYWVVVPPDEQGENMILAKDKNGDPIEVSAEANLPQGILIPTGNYTLTWDRVLEPPWTTIRKTRGLINDAEFMGAPEGTVMFLGAQIDRKFQLMENSGYWQVQYKFAERSITLNSGTEVGWNYFFSGIIENIDGYDGETLGNWNTLTTNPGTANANPGPWQSVGGAGYIPKFNTTAATYNPPYQSADFTQLFQFDNGIEC